MVIQKGNRLFVNHLKPGIYISCKVFVVRKSEDLHESLMRFWHVKYVTDVKEHCDMSEEGKWALSYLSESLIEIGGRYQEAFH